MADYIQRLREIEQLETNVQRNVPPRRVLGDMNNPLEYLTDEQFRSRYRLRKASYRHLLPLLHEELEHINQRGRRLPPHMQLLCALRFYACGTFQEVCGDLQNISQPSRSRIVYKVSRVLASQRARFIRFPDGNEADEVRNNFRKKYGLPQVIGCIDCTHIPIQSPGGENRERFRCRKGYMSINVQAICNDKLYFTNIVARWPRLVHDSRVINNSEICAKLENGEIEGLLLGDAGYARLPYLLTPFRNPASLAQRRYNSAHRRTRSTVERMFGVWKRRFACLKMTLRTKLTTTLSIIIATTVLHNFAMHMNEPEWEEIDIENLLHDENENDLHIENNAMGEAVRDTVVQRYFA